MAGQLPLGHPEYRHLIDFVRPGHGKDNSKKQYPTTLTPPSISGNEARSFYEEVCQETVTGDKINIARRKRKSSLGEHNKRNRKRSYHGSENLSDFRAAKPGLTNDIDLIEKKACGTVHCDLDEKDTSADISYSCCASNSGDAKSGVSKLSQRVKDHRKSELLRLAQNGDANGVTRLLRQGVDVDGVDRFGWTAIMSAAFEGHVDILQTLVRAGADITISNSSGQTALSLAREKGHRSVVHFIKSFQREGFTACESRVKKKQTDSFYCDVCKSQFTDTDKETHIRSTVHIFNTGKKPKDDFFLISSSNVGYQLMLKTGWDGNKGLGPSGQGQKFPVKTFLKRDRKGLGNAVTEKAKVTHFEAKDKTAVAGGHSGFSKREANVKTLSRRAQRVKERREKQKVIDLRRQLS